MAFGGKATYSAGATLPENVDDVSDLVGIVSPVEAPVLSLLGDARTPARSTVHEWLEDAHLPNTDIINDSSYSPDPLTATLVTMTNGSRFRIGDLIQLEGSTEVILVTGIASNDLTIVRGYGGSTATNLANGAKVTILGNAELEGADAAAARFANRARKVNYTQIFAATVEVSGTEMATIQHGVPDELEYQKKLRLEEMLRDLENIVLNGRAPAASPEGSATVRRSMKGLDQMMTTNRFVPGAGGFPADTSITEEQINKALQGIWKVSAVVPDTIVVSSAQKRTINQFISPSRRYLIADETMKSLVSAYESDFGIQRLVISRWIRKGTTLFLSSGRIEVKPLQSRSFHYKAFAPEGDRVRGQVVGEYTCELRNESSCGIIAGLAE